MPGKTFCTDFSKERKNEQPSRDTDAKKLLAQLTIIVKKLRVK